jgi:hypothetical protein
MPRANCGLATLISAHDLNSVCIADPSPLQGARGAKGHILTLPPRGSPSPRQRSAGRGLGRAQTLSQTRAAVASRRDGLLPLNLSSEMVRTRSTASHSFRAKSGTRWNASLPSSGAQGAPRCRGVLSPTLSSKGGEGYRVVGWWQCQDTPGAKG